jgi:hypothetical protein
MEWSEPTLQGGVRRRLLILVADLGSALGSATPSHGGAWWDMVGHGGARRCNPRSMLCCCGWRKRAGLPLLAIGSLPLDQLATATYLRDELSNYRLIMASPSHSLPHEAIAGKIAPRTRGFQPSPQDVPRISTPAHQCRWVQWAKKLGKAMFCGFIAPQLSTQPASPFASSSLSSSL